MKKIPIFDSLSHPTVTGKWKPLSINSVSKNANFKSLANEMKKNKIYKTLAVGLDNFEGYSHKKFYDLCKNFKELVPVAGLNPIKSSKKISDEIYNLKKIGYRIVKLHPRISNFSIEDKKLISAIKAIEEQDMILLFCCYQHFSLKHPQEKDFLLSLIKLFKVCKKTKAVLLHGGSTQVMNFAEFVRANPERFLLDLSMTIFKYNKSSIDLDIKFLFNNFDERICVGSDFPEYSHFELRNRFNFFSRGLNKRKIENIAFKNLEKFLT
jgi:predicted TIM-barrel fold metal-dependent hydrolase